MAQGSPIAPPRGAGRLPRAGLIEETIMGTAGWIILGVIVLIVLVGIVIYNRLVSLRQTINQAWSDISVQLKQRHDLVPNLVETVKGYAAHERGTLEAVVQARNATVS